METQASPFRKLGSYGYKLRFRMQDFLFPRVMKEIKIRIRSADRAVDNKHSFTSFTDTFLLSAILPGHTLALFTFVDRMKVKEMSAAALLQEDDEKQKNRDTRSKKRRRNVFCSWKVKKK